MNDFAPAYLWAICPECLPDLMRRMAAPTPHVAMRQPPPTLRMEPGRNGKSVAVIDIASVMTKAGSWWGGPGTAQIRQDIRRAAADPNVSGIMLAIDSPGGTVAGTADLAADVREARRSKPVYAQIEDLGASAAYWVASQASAVFANDPTALVGSIGTLLTVYDMSEAAKREGVEAVVFATGELKGTGLPGAPVTEAQRQYLQGVVNATQTYFDAAVKNGRGLSAAELAAVRTGGVFPAATALDLKLIDGIQPAGRTLKALANER